MSLFVNDTATTEIYTLSLHDALPIYIIPRARGEAERMVQEAQGFRDSQEARARGEAQRFVQVLSAYQQAQDVTIRRLYLETMEDRKSTRLKLQSRQYLVCRLLLEKKK